MIAQVNLMYKGITKQEGGSFLNDKGVNTPYEPKYVVKFDDINKETGEAQESKFKFNINNTTLSNKLAKVLPYQQLPFIFNLTMQANGTPNKPELVDIDITKAKLKE